MYTRILAPINGGEPARRALDLATHLALSGGAELALLTVADIRLTYALEAGIVPTDLLASLRREGQAYLRNASRSVPHPLRPVQLLREGEPAHEIIRVAHEWRADLIVLGRSGRTGLGRLLSGGAVEAVTRQAPCPVLVARPTAVSERRFSWGRWGRFLRRMRQPAGADCPDRAPV